MALDIEGILKGMQGFGNACQIGEDAFDVIVKGSADAPTLRERHALAITAVTLVLTDVAHCIAEDGGKSPQETIAKVVQHALACFPAPPPPKVEALPVRAVKPGPSPWGNVR